MPAQITSAIPQQNFELVRDRIGEILATELAGQASLGVTDASGITVWISRSRPFKSDSETPAINVSLETGDWGNKNVHNVDGTYVYNIDVYTAEKAKDDPDNEGEKIYGDKLSEHRNHRIIGLCRAIMENPAYATLGFTPGNVGAVSCSRMQPIGQDDQDMHSTCVFRIQVSVRALEGVQLQSGITLAFATTRVYLEETESGLRFNWGIVAEMQVGDNGTTFSIPAAYSGLTVALINSGQQDYNTRCFTQSGDEISMTNGANLHGKMITLTFANSRYVTEVTTTAAGSTITLPEALANETIAFVNTGQQSYNRRAFTRSEDGLTLSFTNGTTLPAGRRVTLYHGVNVIEITANSGALFNVPEAHSGEEVGLVYTGQTGYNRTCFRQTGDSGVMTNGTTFTNGQQLTLLTR